MAKTERDVWQETQVTDEGLSVTTYSQAADQEPDVEDESYWTWAELLDLMHENADFADVEQLGDG